MLIHAFFKHMIGLSTSIEDVMTETLQVVFSFSYHLKMWVQELR